MNEVERIRKLLADTKAGEKGWRKVLASAEGSHSRTLAQNNLSRLAALRVTLVSELNTAVSGQRAGIPAVTNKGVSAEDWTDNGTGHLLSQT